MFIPTLDIVFIKMLPSVFALIIGCVIATPTDLQPKIVGGKDATAGQFPYQVSLRNSRSGSHFCGGSIISSQWILTAANCVPNLQANDIVIVVGTIYLNWGGVSYRIFNITSHGGYNPANNVNDIAVLAVIGNIVLRENVTTIGLSTCAVPDSTALTLSGWGLTSYPSNQLPNNLQYITLQSINITQCQQRLPGYSVFNTNLCTSSPKGQGACRGDNGSPLVYGSQQVGITSWGIPCATGKPDVFTSVAAYREWIKLVTGV